MPRKFSKKFYNSKCWKKIRQSYIASKFGICERCGKTNAKQVHHKEYLTEDNLDNPTISIDFDNLELLCDTCHQHEHHKQSEATIEGLMFDEEGNLIKILPPHQNK